MCSTTGFVVWAESTDEPLPEAQAALQSNAQVAVSEGHWLVFEPQAHTATTGLIFYPGARVDPRAYAPAAREIAAEGFLVVIVPMPLNLAVLSPNRAEAVMEAFPNITTWALGGHSLGGAMACSFARVNPERVAGLALWAAYPQPADDLSHLAIPTVLLDGTDDGVIRRDRLEIGLTLLPSGARYIQIEGGNHAQFGWYGPQSGDNPASISREDQQQRAIEATLEMLHEVAREG